MYVHIPYCRRRCNYCDFAIVPVGEGRTTGGDDGGGGGVGGRGGAGFADIDRRYRKAVLDESDALGRSWRSSPSSSTPPSSSRSRLRSVYFGGGTPSLAPPTTLSAILDAIRHNFELDDDAEVTIEMDPGTFDVAYLESIRDMGFNRISLGVQSFDDSILETLGRVHRRSDVYRSVGMVGEVFGFERANYSIDLMSGVPAQTLAGWAETLREASCDLRPKPAHMSLYDLQVEEGTAFGRWYRDAVVGGEDRRVFFGGGEGAVAPRPPPLSRPSLPSSEDTAFMYAYASGYLRCRGYEHYEISSYAKRGKRRDDDDDDVDDDDVDDDDDYERGGGGRRRRRRIGRKKEPENNYRGTHNQIYWEYDGRWHAVGLGATSNVDGMRYARPRAMSDYISWTEELGVAGDARAMTTEDIGGIRFGLDRMPRQLRRYSRRGDTARLRIGFGSEARTQGCRQYVVGRGDARIHPIERPERIPLLEPHNFQHIHGAVGDELGPREERPSSGDALLRRDNDVRVVFIPYCSNNREKNSGLGIKY